MSPTGSTIVLTIHWLCVCVYLQCQGESPGLGQPPLQLTGLWSRPDHRSLKSWARGLPLSCTPDPAAGSDWGRGKAMKRQRADGALAGCTGESLPAAAAADCSVSPGDAASADLGSTPCSC